METMNDLDMNESMNEYANEREPVAGPEGGAMGPRPLHWAACSAYFWLREAQFEIEMSRFQHILSNIDPFLENAPKKKLP